MNKLFLVAMVAVLGCVWTGIASAQDKSPAREPVTQVRMVLECKDSAPAGLDLGEQSTHKVCTWHTVLVSK